ncbi:MAG: hypothetical protein LH470_00170 [Lysobacter sp.]|nr:hypothetical protein [Lysobacter sp.]
MSSRTRQPDSRRHWHTTARRWCRKGALSLYLVSVAAACGFPEVEKAGTVAQPKDQPSAALPDPALQTAATPGFGAGIPLDLTYVDRKSPEYQRFKSFVDSAVGGSPGYAFAAIDAALMYRLSNERKYCDLAVSMVEQQVSEAETSIAGGGRPAVSGDSYLEVGPLIADLSLTLDSCAEHVTPEQRQRWSAYAEQAVWNVWHHIRANWGNSPHPWTGWSTDNPGNNYYYSFLEATMYWALASGSGTWMATLREEKLPPLQTYFSKLPGGGSSEGTGYGAAHMRLFSLYRLWRDATGVDLANANTHVTDSIAYWVHATVPTLDRFAPIGDQSRNSVPEIYDYHRRVVLEARALSKDARAQEVASWWLGNISVPRMTAGFNTRHDLLPAGDGGKPPTELLYHAQGTGHLFARTGWDKDAMWMAFVAGPYNESHAHQDQGAFTLFANDWLAVTENIWSHSGIQQGPEVHNVVRFERSNTEARQCHSPDGDRVVHQCEPTRSSMTVTPGAAGSFSATADLTAAYGGNPAVRGWQRRVEFADRHLTVRDKFELGAGTRAIFQVNVPDEPTTTGREATAGRLHVKVLEPADAVLSVHDWRKVDGQEFRRGWRIDVSGSDTGYVVQLAEK